MGKELSDEKKLYIVEMLEKGCTYKQISADLGISNGTIAAVKREFFGDDKMRKSIVAGDKFHGLLECVGKNQFKGSVRVKGGKFETKRFITSSRQEAEKLWNEWKEEVLKDQAPIIANPPIVVTRGNNKYSYTPTHPTDENREVTKVAIPKKEGIATASDKQFYSPNPTDRNSDIIEVEIPKKEEAQAKVKPGPLYLLTLDNPRVAGYLYDEEDALKLMNILNHALEATGMALRYNVVPVKYYDKEN